MRVGRDRVPDARQLARVELSAGAGRTVPVHGRVWPFVRSAGVAVHPRNRAGQRHPLFDHHELGDCLDGHHSLPHSHGRPLER